MADDGKNVPCNGPLLPMPTLSVACTPSLHFPDTDYTFKAFKLSIGR